MLESLKLWIWPAFALAVALAAGYLFRNFLVQRMARLSQRTKSDVDDILLESSRRHIPFWFLLAGLAIATRPAPLSSDVVGKIDVLLRDLFILSLTLVVANLITAGVQRATARTGGTLASSSLLRNVVRWTVVVIGILVVIQQHHITITPVLGALGIGSLAVALALQPTLSNLFAGLYITLARPLRIGDFVELENGVQGHILDIGWRATKLREGANSLVNVPNSRLVEMISKNYSLPDPEQVVTVAVGVSYGSDLERVEAVTLEVAREVQETVPEGVPGYAPVVRFQAFGPSSIDFLVVLRTRQFPDRGGLVHAFIKRLRARYAREGIEIPFPQQVVHQADT